MTREEILNTPHIGELDYLIAQYITKLPKEQIEYGDVPAYTRNMNCAWEVVSRFKGFFQLTRDFSLTNPNWYAAFSSADGVKGKTAPEVICKAALIAVLGL